MVLLFIDADEEMEIMGGWNKDNSVSVLQWSVSNSCTYIGSKINKVLDMIIIIFE